jgi:hypothetical protein
MKRAMALIVALLLLPLLVRLLVAEGPHPVFYGGDTSLSANTTSSPGIVAAQALTPAVQIVDNETITVTDAVSFFDVVDMETVHLGDAAFVTPLINVAAPVVDYLVGSLGFGNVAAGQTGMQSLTVSDIGQAPLLLSTATVSQGSAFSIAQIVCSNGATALPTKLPVGGACTFLISYSAPSGAAVSDTLTFTDNAALSNVPSVQAGSSYTQSIPLNGSGTTSPPPPPPPAVIPVMDNETVTLTDAISFSDVIDMETIHVADAVFVTPLISVTAPVVGYSAGSLGFANVPAGQTGSQSLSVSDIGQAPLLLSSATVSQGSAFSIAQIVCSNGAMSAPTTLPVGGACTFLISYSAPSGAAVDDTLTFTDNAALSNVPTAQVGSSYTQSIPLNGSGTTTPPPPPPPATIPLTDNETVTVTDAVSFPDVVDSETVHVTDATFVTPLINVDAPVVDYSAGSLGFGNVAAGQIGTQLLTVSDIGKAPLTLSSAVISQGSAFTILQITCSNGASSLPTTLPVGGVCTLMISYLAPSGAAANDTLTFADNAALSNVPTGQAGSSYTQSVPLNGSGTSTPPPPPPPSVIPVTDNETITVTDAVSFSDVVDSETITVSDQVTVNVIETPTTTSISAPGVTYGTAASATVSVSSSSGVVAGNVMLSVDGGVASSLPLSGGAATFNLGVLSAGNHTLAANFAARGAFNASSATGAITVAQAVPTVSFTGAPASAGYQSTFTVTAKTNASATAAITASGACSITGVTVTMTSGTGTCTLTATWSADNNYLAASATQTTAAAKIAPTPMFTGAPASVPYSSSFAVTATTNASTTATISASGPCSIAGVTVTMTSGTGTCNLTANWPADSNYLGASASQSTIATKAGSTTTIVSYAPNPSVVGQAVAVKFTVSGNGTPTGTVTVTDGAVDSCMATVATSACSLLITTAGTKTLTASYSGDGNFAASASAGISQTVNKGNTTINIAGQSPNPSVAGQAVTISFAIGVVAPASGTPGGTVTVSDGIGDSCTASISLGNCKVTFAAAGTKTVTASYSGDANFNASSSAGVTHNVTDFSILAKPSSQSIKAGQKASYSVTVTPLNGFTGTVSISCGGAPPGGTCTLSANTVTSSGSSSMNVSAAVQTSKSTPTATYTLTLTAIFGNGTPATGGLTHTAKFTLTVQ